MITFQVFVVVWLQQHFMPIPFFSRPFAKLVRSCGALSLDGAIHSWLSSKFLSCAVILTFSSTLVTPSSSSACRLEPSSHRPFSFVRAISAIGLCHQFTTVFASQNFGWFSWQHLRFGYSNLKTETMKINPKTNLHLPHSSKHHLLLQQQRCPSYLTPLFLPQPSTELQRLNPLPLLDHY